MRLRHRLLLSIVTLVALPAGTAAAAGDPIMPLSQVHGGMNCTGESVVQGTTISSFNVYVMDIVQDPQQGPRILVRVSGPAVDLTGVAQGFSGSPVLCDDGTGTMRNIGAISAGIGEYGNRVALVTPIEQMLGEPVSPPSSAPRLHLVGTPLQGPLTVGGLSPSLFSLFQEAARRAGRTVIADPSGPSVSFPVQPLVPGASVGAAYSSGAVPIGAIGTVSYRDGDHVYAFGHPLDGAGRRSLILQDAYVYYVVPNPGVDLSTSYKLAAFGHTVGTLTSDTPNAVIGAVGAPPPTIPLDVSARDGDTGARLTQQTQVADESGIGFPVGGSLVGMVGPLAIAQAATQIYNGAPANESGHMCLSITIRESRAPLAFCNRYVSTGVPGGSGLLPPALALSAAGDASQAFSIIDSVQFATIHVTHIAAALDAERGLREASIVSARAPARVKAGQRVSVHLLVRVIRGSLRRVSFKVRIPRGLHGAVSAKLGGAVAGGGMAGAQALESALGAALGGASVTFGPAPPPPGSVRSLRRAVAAIAPYDGLLVRFGHRAPARIYRDPSLLITGQAKVVFRVKR
ncbi:MAG: hypothetical protein QOG59_748 [Solirubrobacteraceae bacterium]|jgi:hypothetical protein|nr:hypothetical protein [Solirubrobacteraceae bacterium]